MSSNLKNGFNGLYNEKERILTSDKLETIFKPGDSVGQVLFDRLKSNPNNILQIDDTYQVTATNGQVLRWAMSIAKNLTQLGFDHTDIVGISAKNSTYVLPVVLACFFNCTPFHAINSDLDEASVAHCFGLTKPKLVFCDGEIYGKILAATKDYCQSIVTISEHIEGVAKVLDLANASLEEDSYKPQQLVEGPNQTVAILSSSGTTGKPKAICLAAACLLSEIPSLTGDFTMFMSSSIDWFTGLWYLINNCLTNCTRVISKRPFAVNNFFELLKRYQISYAFLSSHYVAMIASHPMATRERLSSLKVLQFGGSSLSEATLQRLTELIAKDALIGFGYGLTEIGAVAFNIGKSHLKAVGKLLPNLKLRVINERGENLGLNEVGEILIKTAIPWKGYYKNPEETARSVDPEGWFYTGDLGYIDEEYYLYLVDRKKDVLKYQGHQYWPREIENVIAEIPDVMEVCVVPVHDDIYGDVAGALLVKTAKSPLTTLQVQDHVRNRLIVPHKQLNAGVYFVEKLPYNHNNKCVRSKAKLMLESLISK